MGVACSANGRYENAYKLLVGNLEGKRAIVRSRLSLEDKFKINRREM
jgi:hypothetical protein